MSNDSLHAAMRRANDEFYTRYDDIAAEVEHCREQFKGKSVYLNCDDYRKSQFYRFFVDEFHALGLSRLDATGYAETQMDLWGVRTPERACHAAYDGHGEIVIGLHGDGDFRSAECVDLLKQADIVVTNPPFSLFREYVAQLVEHGKQFLVLGNMNAITYKEVFPLIKDGKMWLGVNNGSKSYEVPERCRDNPGVYAENGRWYAKMGNTVWVTNLDYQKRHEVLVLGETYTPEAYPTYDNYDAIEVSKVRDIPRDYWGAMGVPITFLDKHNPDQFEIVGITDRSNSSGLRTKKYEPADTPRWNDLNARSAIKMPDGSHQAVYARVIIKRVSDEEKSGLIRPYLDGKELYKRILIRQKV